MYSSVETNLFSYTFGQFLYSYALVCILEHNNIKKKIKNIISANEPDRVRLNEKFIKLRNW